MNANIRFDKFYKLYGLRKTRDLIYPKILLTTDLILPRNSMLHYYTQNSAVYPNKDIEIFSNIINCNILNLFEFINPIYEFKHINTNEISLATKYKKLSKDFITITNPKKMKYLFNKNNFIYRNTVMYNYSTMPDRYRLVERIDTNYKVSKDILNSIIENIHEINHMDIKTKESIHHFIILDLPKVLLSVEKFKVYVEKKDDDILIYKEFYNTNRVLLLELMKIFSFDKYKTTIFKNINSLEEMKSINFILKLDNKFVIVNLAVLLSFNKEYELINNSTKLNSKSYMKLFHYFIKLIYNLDGNNSVDISSGKYSNNIDKLLYSNGNDKLSVTDIENGKDVKLVDIDKIELDTEEDSTVEDAKLIDKVLKIEDTKEVDKVDEIVEKHSDIDMLLSNEGNVIDEIHTEISYNIVDKKRKKMLEEQLETILNTESPYKDGNTFKDMLTYNKEELNISDKDKTLPDNDTIFNKDLLQDGVHNLDKQYISKVYKKDIVNSVFNIQKAGMVIKDYDIQTYEDILGKYEEHSITFKDFDKGTSTVKFKLPVINEDGIYQISNNNYRMKSSKLSIPIDKINNSRVSLTTAYSKMFIDKAPYKKIDRGYKIQQALVKKQMKNEVNNIVLMENSVYDIKLPSDYSNTMRYISSFNFKDSYYFFDYPNRGSILSKDITLKAIEKDNKILLGRSKTGYLLIDRANEVYEYVNKKYKPLGRLLDVLEIPIDDLVKEYALIKISKTYIPIVYLLSYYLTFNKLLKSLNVIVEEFKLGTRVHSDENSIVVKFVDTILKITFKDDKSRVILAGLDYFNKINKVFTKDSLNHKDSMDGMFKEFGLRLLDVTNIKNLEILFVDPVSVTILKEMNEPTTFIGLLYRSAELLVDDFYHKPNSKTGFLVKGYEKVPQMLYNQLVLAVRDRDNRSVFGKSKLKVDPYSVWRAMGEDSTSILIDDINPLAYLKQKENITATGFMGRGKDTMSKGTREVLAEDIGIISEAGVDSGDVGITSFLSANPNIKNVRGMKGDAEKLTVSNVFSTSALLAPFSTYDDPKRLVFTGVMNSHVLSMKNASVYPIRTGYETLLPYKLDRQFIAYATEDGVVEKVFNNKVIIKYKDKKETYTFRDWTSKEESGASWKHNMSTNLKVGDKLTNGDIIYYDSSFFTIDFFNPKGVVYKVYMTVRTALDEVNGSYEDSGIINRKFSNFATIESTKVRSIVLDKNDIINNVVKVNSKVEPNDILFNISTGLVETGDLSEESMDLLQSFVKNSPKAKLKGKIVKIMLYYNCDKDELNKSFKDLLEDSEKYMVDQFTNKKFSGRVNGSYSINGVPLDADKVEIKIYIEAETSMGTGDKGVLGNQLKFTVGEIVDDIKTLDGDKDVDVIFSARSLSSRIVNSPYLSGSTAYLLEIVEDEIVDMYYN